jgi:hypothetical protein
MKRPQLKPYLLNWLNENKGWHKKVDLYVIGDQIEHSAESTGRALRLLVKPKDGSQPKIKVSYYDGRWARGLVKYSSLDTPEPVKKNYKIEIVNGTPTAVYG